MSVRFDAHPDAESRAAFERACAAADISVYGFTDHAASRRSFALLVGAEPFDYPGITLRTPPLVSLWIEPRMPAALPSLARALGGAGRPAGATLTEQTAVGLLVEVHDELTPIVTIVRLVDVELARYGEPGRQIAFAGPITATALARIAADGLGDAEIDAARIIEYHVQDAVT